MNLQDYLDARYQLVDKGLRMFIHGQYKDDLLEMAAHLAIGGKRLRGMMALMCCEAWGGQPERAVTAACAVELAHAVSLVKDDVMDGDSERRGGLSFWKRFGIDLGLLVPDIIMPHAVLLVQEYGAQAVLPVLKAWGQIARGQLMDFPMGGYVGNPNYEQIISLKTAPLFEVACELGVRAAKMDWQINVAKQYGWNCGMAFQVYDDYTDLRKAVNQPWEATANGSVPLSIRALQILHGGQEVVTEEACAAVLAMGAQYLNRALASVGTFPDSEVKSLLMELPQFCCDSLIDEAEAALASARVPNPSEGGA